MIDRPQTKADTVEILAICNFRCDGTAVSATAAYGDSPATETGILDGGVWTTHNTGKDAFKFILPGKPAFHGIVEINAAQQFNYDFNTSQFYGVDLYSVLLHECLHMLGIATFIKPDGTSITNNKASGYYRRFDAMLRIGNKPLIRRYNDCFSIFDFPFDLNEDRMVNNKNIWPFYKFNETWDKDINNEEMVGLRNARFYLDDSDSTTLFNRNEGVVQVLTTKNADRNGYYVLDIHVYGIGSDIGIPKPSVSSRISATVTSKNICTLFPDWKQEISPQDYGGQIILDSIF